MGIANLYSLYDSLSMKELLWFFIIVGTFHILLSNVYNQDKTSFFPPLSFIVLLYFFHTFVVTFPGLYGFRRSSVATLPFLLIIALYSIEKSISSNKIIIFLFFLLVSKYFYKSFILTDHKISIKNKIGQSLIPINQILRNEHIQDIVVMTRDPWELNLYSISS